MDQGDFHLVSLGLRAELGLRKESSRRASQFASRESEAWEFSSMLCWRPEDRITISANGDEMAVISIRAHARRCCRSMFVTAALGESSRSVSIIQSGSPDAHRDTGYNHLRQRRGVAVEVRRRRFGNELSRFSAWIDSLLVTP